RPDGLPQYVGIPNQPFMTKPAYLGLGHQGFNTGDPSAPTYTPPKLGLAGGVDPGRFDDRRVLPGHFDALRPDLDYPGALEGSDKLRASARRMLTNPPTARAFDVTKEAPRRRDRYGRHLWGQGS